MASLGTNHALTSLTEYNLRVYLTIPVSERRLQPCGNTYGWGRGTEMGQSGGQGASRRNLPHSEPWADANSRGVPAHFREFLLRDASAHTIRAGQRLFAMGDVSDACYWTSRGLFKGSLLSAGGTERIVQIFGPGDVIGVPALIARQPRVLTVEALSDSEYLRIDGAFFLQQLERDAESRAAVLARVASGLRRGETMLEETTWSGEERIASALIRLCKRIAGDAARTMPIEVELGQSDLASLAATARETVSRAIREWKRKGIILRSSYGRYTVDCLRLVNEFNGDGKIRRILGGGSDSKRPPND
jgi:CRP-like cAMP-binding protein